MYQYKALVIRVIDGDTLDLDIDLGLNVHVRERVRLAGIDTPEIHGVKKESEEYQAGMESKNRLIELLAGKEVIINTFKDKKGKYGRYIAEVFLNGESISEKLLQEGLAQPYM